MKTRNAMRIPWRRVAVGLAIPLALTLGGGRVETLSAAVMVIPFGAPGDLPVVGNWTGDNTTYIGVYRPSTNTFLLRIHNAAGPPDLVLPFGAAGDLPVVGHWCKFSGLTNLVDKPAVYRPSTNSLFRRCTNDTPVVFSSPLGAANDVPVAGDWDFDGVSSIGVYRPSTNTFFLTDDNATVTIVTPFGAPGDVPVIRHFFCCSLIGVYRPSTSTFFLSDSNTAPSLITVIPFGAPGDLPLIGDWTGDSILKVGVYRPSDNTFYLKTTFP